MRGLILVALLAIPLTLKAELPTATPTVKAMVTPKKKATPKPFKGCQRGTASGGLGFTYKATAAHFPQALAILPSTFVQNWSYVGVYRTNGRRISSMTMKGDGVCLPGMAECVRRPSFLASMSGAALERRYKHIVIKALKKRPKECWYWYIRKPSVRAPLHH